MAKSKNGGSRAFLRGRIGSDVYSVGKDGMGKKQQVVRSLAVQVDNPRTQNQMFGRMVMSTVMQAVSALSPIIDHSFDGVAKGQPSISEFIRRNYALVKADAIAHPSLGNNDFGLNKYQEKGIRCGAWVVSDGSVVIPAAITKISAGIQIALTAGTLTVGGLKAAMGSIADGYLTYIGIKAGGGSARYVRFELTTTLADDTTITSGNVDSLFTISGSAAGLVQLDGNNIKLWGDPNAEDDTDGMIATQKTADGYEHSACTLVNIGSVQWKADVALPTYPVGTEQFLNGGDI